MMSLLERYIASTMLKAVAVTLLVLVVLLVFFGTLDEFDDVGQGAYTSLDAFLVALAASPRYIFEVFPVAAMLGSLIGLGAMSAHGELIAMRSAGFSLRQIVFAVLKAGLAMMVLVFLFGEIVAPRVEQWGEQYRLEKQQRKVTLKTDYGFWARDGRAFVNIRGINPGGRLNDIYVYEFDDQRQLTVATHAKRAEYRNGGWLMFDISQTDVSVKGTSRHEIAQARWDSLLDPGLLGAILLQPNMLPLGELYQYIKVMHANGQSATDYEVAFWSKIVTPLATLVMLFFSVPFVLSHQRFVSLGQRIFLGIMLGMAFYTLNRGMSYVAVVYDFSPMLSALIPGLAFLAMGVYLLRGVR